MICKQCGKEFEAKRITAQYCSNQCRVKANRLSVSNNISVTKPLSVTDKPIALTYPITDKHLADINSALLSEVSAIEQEVKFFNILAENQTSYTPQGCTQTNQAISSIPLKLPDNYGQPDCTCMHCKQVAINNLKLTVNHGEPVCEQGVVNRVSLPSDSDYSGVCTC